MDASIESAEDLAKQSKIKYGAVWGGSTLAFFKVTYTMTTITSVLKFVFFFFFVTFQQKGIELLHISTYVGSYGIIRTIGFRKK